MLKYHYSIRYQIYLRTNVVEENLYFFFMNNFFIFNTSINIKIIIIKCILKNINIFFLTLNWSPQVIMKQRSAISYNVDIQSKFYILIITM